MNGLCSLSTALCIISAVGGAARSVVGDAVSSAWQQVCQSFADAAVQMLQAFAHAFAVIPDISLTSTGIDPQWARNDHHRVGRSPYAERGVPGQGKVRSVPPPSVAQPAQPLPEGFWTLRHRALSVPSANTSVRPSS